MLDRFEQFISPEPNSGCWLWTGAVAGFGYGKFYYCGRQWQAHRFAYYLEHGGIPDWNPEVFQVHHTCDVPSCVNPQHLWLGSQADNVHDAMDKGRHPTPPNRWRLH